MLRVQITAARLIVGACRFDHDAYSQGPPLATHTCLWLEFKILLLTYRCLHNQGSSELLELLKFRNHLCTLLPPRNSYFKFTLPQQCVLVHAKVRGYLPSLLLNFGTLYLNMLSHPCPCQPLNRHLKLTFFATISLMNNDTLIL